jgi:crotonobetainyl-CoA:carnitine CoA-transferase CaiB-like acyl-CoA transferase
MGAAAVLAALEKRARTGMGSYLDVAQYECGLMFLAGPLLDYHRSGAIAERAGNDDPDAAPHGAYACSDGGWIALSCWSDAEFARLAGVVGGGARDARLATFAGRKAHRELLDEAIAQWTGSCRSEAAAEALQRAQVHAHPVNTMADLFADPQLEARRQWRRRTHPVLGHHAYCMPAFDLPEMPGDVTLPAPTLGQHNEDVFRGLLSLSEAEYATFRAAGALA